MSYLTKTSFEKRNDYGIFIKNNVAMISNNDVVPFSHEAEADRNVQKEIFVVLREVNA